MQPIPAPEPYTLPLTMRITRRDIIMLFLFFLFLSGLSGFGGFADSSGTMEWRMFSFLFSAGILLFCLDLITREIRLTEDKISYRAGFSWKEMEYSRITAVRYYYQETGMASLPALELTGDSGNTIIVGIDSFDSPKNRFIIYDVLKKKATRAGIYKPMVEFYTVPEENSWKKNLLPRPYRFLSPCGWRGTLSCTG
jgi:hypothetical protein